MASLKEIGMKTRDSLQEGDYVAHYGSGTWSTSLAKVQVTRTTATRIYLGDRAFTRSRGVLVGSSSWNRERIEPWERGHDEEFAEQAQERRLAFSRRALRDYAWKDVDQITADAVLSILKLNEPEKELPA